MFQLTQEDTNCLLDEVSGQIEGKTLVLVRGLPGLGKSTFGAELCERNNGIQIENDMQFMVSGEYMFDPSKLEDAHMATQLETRNILAEEAPFVVVSNTFTREWEMSAYRLLAERFNYTLITIDMLLAVRMNAQKRDEYFHVSKFLEFLCTRNVHTVPEEKIRSMYDRYESSEDVIMITRPVQPTDMDISPRFVHSNATSASVVLFDAACPFSVLDTGYYLALDLKVPDDVSTPHSTIYQYCINASQDILRVFGISSGYKMIRKLSTRNAKSHGMSYAMRQMEAITQQTCTNPHVNARNAAKLAAGWTRYHVTILSPAEYTLLKNNDSFEQFLMFLKEVNFKPLMMCTADSVLLGLQCGAIASESLPFQMDEIGRRAGLSERTFSTALYALLDPTNSTFVEISSLRERFGFKLVEPSVEVAGAAASAATPVVTVERWQPHITLAFTHNDVRADPADPATWDKLAGVARYANIRNAILCDTENNSSVSADAGKPAATNLQLDSPTFSLATMFLYSEVQASFKMSQFGFTVVDLKVRKGAMGDDATYRSHPFLQAYLPRGMVFLQHEVTGCIYRGLFSLRKFYGKEGVEDDGIGIGASQLNYKLTRTLERTSAILVMEKVNGRAASSRFFRYQDEIYVIVGTKLSHVICKVDMRLCQLVLPSTTSADGANIRNINEKDDNDDEDEVDGEDARSSKARAYRDDSVDHTADIAITTSTSGPQAIDLIISNVTALQSNLRWERLIEFEQWLDGRTFNGEVLDPIEMHLVVLTKHEWVSLCVTDFLVVPAATSTNSTADSLVSNSTSDSALQNMFKFADFTHCIPAYESHALVATPASGGNADMGGGAHEEDLTAIRAYKRNMFNSITASIVHARDSEGKVLYFLDESGEVVELLKFKTWWYIWRRSCRELAAQLFSRYYNTSHRGKCVDQDTTEEDRLNGELERTERIFTQMGKANAAAQQSIKFQTRLDEVTSKVNQIRSQLEKLTQRREAPPDYDVTYTALELCSKVQRKWPTKFLFFRSDLGDAYESSVERVCDLAQKFVHWCKAQFKVGKEQFHTDFKTMFPVVWNRFLEDSSETDMM